MTQTIDMDDETTDTASARRHVWRFVLLGLLAFLLVALGVAWWQRESIADRLITDTLASYGIEARYNIERIGADQQVLTDIVIGDPENPDMTIERAQMQISPRFGLPDIAEIRLIKPHLRARFTNGAFDLGTLNPLLEGGDGGPFELPNINLRIVDGRASVTTDYGNVGAALSGSGNLQGGFTAQMAAVSPDMTILECDIRSVQLTGQLAIRSEQPEFKGPLSLRRLNCAGQDISTGQAQADLDLVIDRDLSGGEGKLDLKLADLIVGANRLRHLTGGMDGEWRNDSLNMGYDLTGRNLTTPVMALERAAATGAIRSHAGLSDYDVTGEASGRDIRMGEFVNTSLNDAASAAGDTLFGPILSRIAGNLKSEEARSRFSGEFSYRAGRDGRHLDIPRARLWGGSGDALMSVSRVSFDQTNEEAGRFFGNFTSGGRGLPRIAGRMEKSGNGRTVLRLTMADYAADDNSLAIPELIVLQDGSGRLGFSGRLAASGRLPGGRADDLLVPLSGNISADGVLSLWRRCADIRFGRLQLANLRVEDRSLQLCPAQGQPILRYGAKGLKLSAGVPQLDLAGYLGETPIRLRSGAVGIAYPGKIAARDIHVGLGPIATASTFLISDLRAGVELDGGISGGFAGADVKLAAVPLDILDLAGSWQFADGVLRLTRGGFRLEDRSDSARFEPLVGRDADLTLEDNRITAAAILRDPGSNREVTRAAITHDLATGSGDADLRVDGLVFDEDMQPSDLTQLALGVVANVDGIVTGRGKIAWNEAGITSSGRFSSSNLDFAAPFGPVKGASGTLNFTDLLGLTTAPGQTIQVASVDPGIEVFDGEVSFQILRGETIAVEGGKWPFVGGSLTLRPVRINLGLDETRSYIFEIEGLDAAKFVDRMGLANLSASGIFDGTLPVVFSGENGAIEGGLLLSRPPGGNVSYVGELSYEDLSPMADFAFDALRSLDYRQMRIGMDGPLTGEIVTRVRFDGVSQGDGASNNIITRQIARLPLRFDVNVRAPFYKLIGSLSSLYDPAAVRDPRDLGLIDVEGDMLDRQVTDSELPGGDAAKENPTIQSSESETMP